ncbi:MAG TPA: hypothetical protein PL041_07800 [Melioribacteraceae bacterium]|mgnify:FL=1|nr:hypothetical protein [Melioribacteraceae bacterium]
MLSIKRKDIFASFYLYKVTNLIRYILLLIANLINITAYIYTKQSIYLIVIVIIIALNFAYKYRFTEFKKDFAINYNPNEINRIRTLFE